MGNSHRSSTPNIQLHIQLEYPYYTSGQIMRGVVFLNTAENLMDCALYLTVDGVEKCLWNEGSSLNRRRYSGLNHFFREEFVLNNFDQNKLGPGGYAWPFSLELSANLPGTHQCYLNDETYLRYYVRAELLHYKNPDLSIFQALPVEIREPFRANISSLEGDMEATPRSWFCCGRGRTKIHVHVSKNVVYVGETLDVVVTVDNSQNGGTIKDVLFDLVQNLFVTANCGATRTFKRVRKSMKSDGTQGNSKNSYTLSFTIEPRDIEAPTAIGTIVANFYTLEVTARVPGISLCNQDEPYVSSPLYIMNKSQAPLYTLPHPPLGNFTFMKLQQFHSPPFIFRQNKKLGVMNYQQGSEIHL